GVLSKSFGRCLAMRLPPISIIIPAYNAAGWVLQAIGSCIKQRYESFEVIVVDDGSTDETYSVCYRFVEAAGGPVRIFRTANRGSSAARNTGLDHAIGDYVLFLDADDLLTECALEKLGAIASNGEVDAVFGSHSNFTQESEVESLVPRHLVYR